MKTYRFGQDRINDVKKKLVNLNDEEYDYEIFDFLSEKVNVNESLTKLQEELLATYALEFEVDNGGFDQFYNNNEDQYVDAAIDGLKRIGALDYAQLTESSKKIRADEKKNPKQGRNHDYDPIDDKFYELESYSSQRLKFIKDHLDEILIDESGQ